MAVVCRMNRSDPRLDVDTKVTAITQVSVDEGLIRAVSSSVESDKLDRRIIKLIE